MLHTQGQGSQHWIFNSDYHVNTHTHGQGSQRWIFNSDYHNYQNITLMSLATKGKVVSAGSLIVILILTHTQAQSSQHWMFNSDYHINTHARAG